MKLKDLNNDRRLQLKQHILQDNEKIMILITHISDEPLKLVECL